ncbi:hypothetical protein C8046_09480 [Serinibacter arcticus]|uniref:HTH luxR-type domain-containing protein n=1 Tax=Serinibacter arcticus TaxID=1655435 RepID=A0A2U1ZV27_9MICO|nr:hypothetical protein C8046_09480 [Serinibacter arcticus]
MLKVLDAVSRGRHATIVSAEPEDRSAILGAVRTQLEATGWRTIHVEAVPPLPGAPLAALVHAGLRPTQEGRNGLGAAVDEMAAAVRGERTIVLVRDLHRLDPTAWAVLRSLQQRTGLLLVVSRHPRSATAEMPSDAVTVAAPRPSIEELRTTLAELTGLPVGLALAARLHAYVDGRTALARALVENGERHLGRTSGEPVDLVLTGRGLEPVLEDLVGDLSADERRDLEMLALLGPAELDAIADRLSPESLERLERRGLVEEIGRECPRVLVRPPVLADHLRATVPSLRRRALLGPAASAPATGEPAEAGAVARLLADTESHRVGLARTAWERQPDRDSAVALLTVLESAGLERELHAVLAGSAVLPGSDRAVVEWQALRWRHAARWHGGAADAVAGLRRAAKDAVRHGELLLALALRLDVATPVAQRLAEAEELARSTGHAPWVEGEIRLTLARLQLAIGDLAAAGRTVGAGSPSEGRASDLVMVGAVVAAVEGRESDAVRALEELIATALALRDRDVIRRAVECVVLTALIGLRVPRLTEMLDLGLALGLPLEPGPGQYFALARTGIVHAVAGADSPVVVPAVAVGPPGAEPLGDLVRAWDDLATRSATNQSVDPDGHLEAALTTLSGSGNLFGAALAALTVFEVEPSAGPLERVRQFVTEWGTPAALAHADYAVARAEESAGGLVLAGRAFEERGLVHAAVRAYRRAVLAAGRHDEEAWGREAAEELQRLRHDLAGGPADVPGPGASALTDREREIAGMVAAGASNRVIAQRLVLSVRTVETHVLRIMRKAGVDSRTQIRDYLITQPRSVLGR